MDSVRWCFFISRQQQNVGSDGMACWKKIWGRQGVGRGSPFKYVSPSGCIVSSISKLKKIKNKTSDDFPIRIMYHVMPIIPRPWSTRLACRPKSLSIPRSLQGRGSRLPCRTPCHSILDHLKPGKQCISIHNDHDRVFGTKLKMVLIGSWSRLLSHAMRHAPCADNSLW